MKRAVVFGAVAVGAVVILVACTGDDKSTSGSADAGSDVVVPIADASHDAFDAADAGDAQLVDANVPDADGGSVDAGPCTSASCPAGSYCLSASDVYNTGDPTKNFDPTCVPLPTGCTTCGCAEKDGDERTHLGCSCVDYDGGSGPTPTLPADAGMPFAIGCSEA